MVVKFTPREISAKYDNAASWYDWIEGILDFLGIRMLRRRLVRGASGNILEVAIGTGRNLRYYKTDCHIVGVDISSQMLKVARERAAKLHMNVLFCLGDAEALPFHDRSFDTVVSSLSACTFPNPLRALQEMARVCQTDGRLLLLEHGRSDREWLGRWQDRREDSFAKHFACHWNREPLKIAQLAHLKLAATSRSFLGIFHIIQAKW